MPDRASIRICLLVSFLALLIAAVSFLPWEENGYLSGIGPVAAMSFTMTGWDGPYSSAFVCAALASASLWCSRYKSRSTMVRLSWGFALVGLACTALLVLSENCADHELARKAPYD